MRPARRSPRLPSQRTRAALPAAPREAAARGCSSRRPPPRRAPHHAGSRSAGEMHELGGGPRVQPEPVDDVDVALNHPSAAPVAQRRELGSRTRPRRNRSCAVPSRPASGRSRPALRARAGEQPIRTTIGRLTSVTTSTRPGTTSASAVRRRVAEHVGEDEHACPRRALRPPPRAQPEQRSCAPPSRATMPGCRDGARDASPRQPPTRERVCRA